MQYIQYLQPVELLNNNVEGLVIEWNHTSILWLLCVCVLLSYAAFGLVEFVCP